MPCSIASSRTASSPSTITRSSTSHGGPDFRKKERNMLVELVQTTTRDGVRLDGTYQAPPTVTRPPSVAAFCLVHGTGGNFYSSTLFDAFADRLLRLGCGVLRVNTRGHDGISTASTSKGSRRQGAAYEIVDDC